MSATYKYSGGKTECYITTARPWTRKVIIWILPTNFIFFVYLSKHDTAALQHSMLG